MLGIILSYAFLACLALCRLKDRLERHRRIIRGDVVITGRQPWAEEMAFVRDGKIQAHTMEAAKDLIGKLNFEAPDDVELVDTLISIASDRKAERWSRVAAIYVLGFADNDHRCASLVSELTRDPDPWVSEHANKVFWIFLREEDDRSIAQ